MISVKEDGTDGVKIAAQAGPKIEINVIAAVQQEFDIDRDGEVVAE